MSERKIGFRVDRTVIVEGPFRPHDKMDAVWAPATVETQGVKCRVAVMIAGPAELGFCGPDVDSRMPDDQREEARALFALGELAQRPVRDFERPEPRMLPEIRITVGPGPDSGPRAREMWTIQSIRKHPALQAYTVTCDGSTWTARSRS